MWQYVKRRSRCIISIFSCGFVRDKYNYKFYVEMRKSAITPTNMMTLR